MKALAEWCLDGLEQIEQLPVFVSIRQGLVLLLPLIIVGALTLLLLNIPIPLVNTTLDRVLGANWRLVCELIQRGTFGIAALGVLLSVSISYAEQRNLDNRVPRVSSIVMATVVLSCYFISVTPARGEMGDGFIIWGNGGYSVSLLIALTAAPLFVYFSRCRWMPKRFTAGVGYDPTVRIALRASPPAILTVLIFSAARMVLENCGIQSPHESARIALFLPFQGAESPFGIGVSYLLMSQFLWFFGIHGPTMLSLVEQIILLPASLANTGMAQLGQTPPFILTKPFIDAFVHIGGSGCTLSLILAIFLKGRDPGIRKLALIGIFPALFNVNEVVLFGIPLVLNPIYLIPFLLTPVADFAIAYAATALDFVPRTIQDIHWTSPVLLGGYAATGSLAGVMLQAVNVAVGIGIYLPFVAIANRLHTLRFRRMLDALMDAAGSNVTSAAGKKCIDLPGAEGMLARNLANDLRRAIRSDDQLFLEFQPLFDVAQNRSIGGEALLRWKHPVYGLIPPFLAVTLAEDTGLIHKLGRRVLRQACRQHAKYQSAMVVDHVIAVNMSALQLEMDGVVKMVLEELKACGLKPHMLKIEITESIALAPDDQSVGVLRELQALGVRIAIDDFGMGHTSLRYLKEFPVDTIKIDRSLTQGEPNHVNDQIIQSIIGLCEALGVQITVEGVETEEQLERFKAYGCTQFQGYFFSRPLSGEAYMAYVREHTSVSLEAFFHLNGPESVADLDDENEQECEAEPEGC